VDSSVCLVTSGHVASCPRLVKNADALAEAGYRVHVVAGRYFPPVDPLDREIFASARWSYAVVDSTRGAGAAWRKIVRLGCRALLRLPLPAAEGLTARAHHAQVARFSSAATAAPARFYFGHGLAALPAVAWASRRRGVACGFDAEDYHDEETDAASADPAERTARRALQTRLLPGCALLTAATPMLGEKLRQVYRVDPLTLLNVFPLSQAPSAPFDPAPVASGRAARFYWFSQTIGPGRGLEAVLAIIAAMSTPVELHLRGFVSDDYRARLQAAAGRARISFLPPAPASEMARLAADSDLGLSTEENRPLNRDFALSNKVFTYLLAGLPQLMSRTSAHVALATELGAAAIVADLAQAEATARKLDEFFSRPEQVRVARSSAWQAAHGRFCWDVEKRKFLEAVSAVLSRS
jgi:glycosyltransferase involved in cell wall biosynthesis